MAETWYDSTVLSYKSLSHSLGRAAHRYGYRDRFSCFLKGTFILFFTVSKLTADAQKIHFLKPVSHNKRPSKVIRYIDEKKSKCAVVLERTSFLSGQV